MTRLVTRAEYIRLPPRHQGYVAYMQATRRGSMLKDKNPYAQGTKQADEWDQGQMDAVQEVQDAP